MFKEHQYLTENLPNDVAKKKTTALTPGAAAQVWEANHHVNFQRAIIIKWGRNNNHWWLVVEKLFIGNKLKDFILMNSSLHPAWSIQTVFIHKKCDSILRAELAIYCCFIPASKLIQNKHRPSLCLIGQLQTLWVIPHIGAHLIMSQLWRRIA